MIFSTQGVGERFLNYHHVINCCLYASQFDQGIHSIVFFSRDSLQVVVEIFQQFLDRLNILDQEWVLNFVFPFNLCDDELGVTPYA